MSNTLTESFKALDKATDAIKAAIYDLEGGHLLAATNRCYYAMFYCMTALLLSKNIYAKTHQGLKSKFGEIFIKTGLLPISINEYVQKAFELRQEADYDLDASVSTDEIKTLIDNATDLFNRSKRFLEEI